MTPAETPPRELALHEPERFLRLLHANPHEFDLSTVASPEMWALVAIAALARPQRERPLRVVGSADAPGRRFAYAVGLDDVIEGRKGEIQGDPGRTVRITDVYREEDIDPVAREIAFLLAGEERARQSSRWAMQYVIVELLRNVLQHSGDDLGGIVGAQRNDRGRYSDRPMFQVAVADTGKGIRRSLSQQHMDITDDEVAVERSLWPHFSRAFPRGRTGGEQNAGLGLFYIAELAKDLGGRLLVSSGEATLIVDPGQPKRQSMLRTGYPGTLVAFEVPVEAGVEFDALFEEITKRAEARTPRRIVTEWLRFEEPTSPFTPLLVSQFVENNDKARKLATETIIPRLIKRESVVLDFRNIRVCTQSFMHALLYEPLRFAWASQTPIYVVNTQPAVRSALKHVESYSQGG